MNSKTNQLSTTKMNGLLSLAEQIIQQTHYKQLENWSISKVNSNVMEIVPGDVACLFHVPELVYSQDDNDSNHLVTVLNALYACGASCLMILQCIDGKSDLYLGAVNKQRYENKFFLNTIRDVLRTAVEGNLPGTELKEIITRKDINEKMASFFDNGFDSQCISAVSCVAQKMGKQGEENSQGLERLLGAVGRKNFTLMVLADPVSNDQLASIKEGYENLGTQLSSMENMSVSIQKGTSTTESTNYSETLSKTISDSISLTQTTGTNTGWNHGTSRNDGKQMGSKKRAAVGGLGLLMGVGLGEAGFMASTLVNNLFSSDSVQEGVNDSVSGGTSESKSEAKQKGTQEGKSIQKGSGVSKAETEGKTVQYSVVNQHIHSLKNKLDKYLEWIEYNENYGMFNCCTYIISGSPSTNLLVSSQYQALMQGNQEIAMPTAINTWTKDNGVDDVRQYLMSFNHPVITSDEVQGGFSTAMLMSGHELASQMALPQKSIVGLSVMEYASFGREIVRKTPLKTEKLAKLGQIYHMGRIEENQPVFLDIQSLTSHTFVAGTNGSGKSNTVYRLLDEVSKNNIPFMVIEPAKGEYKNVFGNDPSVKVYGLNRAKSALLGINPFWFNKNVSVRFHIENLMGVFNASWSMYDAMSSVLRSSIENAYKACGWNLKKSCCKHEPVYPTIYDVLKQFEKKMSTSAFSQEVKGNYVGALSARLETLCTGIYEDVFCGTNITDEELFNRSVIIDLSGAGASEVKSMIMGILVIRLEEYRTSNDLMNLPLQHVTVLEEAHHLLKKTSTAQSDQGSNLAGKSVEMISNAINELRSKGEGFVIVDQSPGVMDETVIRNTNTKIILRLPDSNDREIMGKAIGLTPKQIYEISRLKTGVCAIYQKDWLEAVLSQVDKANVTEKPYMYKDGKDYGLESRTKLAKTIISMSKQDSISKKDIDSAIQLVLECGVSGILKKEIISVLKSGVVEKSKINVFVAELLPFDLTIPDTNNSRLFDMWVEDSLSELADEYSLNDEELNILLYALVEGLAQDEKEWEYVYNRLKIAMLSGNDEIKLYRGYAVTMLVSPTAPVQDSVKIADCCQALKKGNKNDAEIADILEKTLNDDIDEKTKEMRLMKLFWDMLICERFFGNSCPEFMKKDIPAWDKLLRSSIGDMLLVDSSVSTRLIDMILRFRSTFEKSPVLRSFYFEWLKISDKNRS